MTEKPLVSVIINCYNGEKYLREAIDSVIAQTYDNWEIVFWDNQSTDSTASIIKSYQDSRFKYFYAQHHTSLGKARNLALEKCNAGLAAFLDSDDIWLPSFLEKSVERFIKEEDSVSGVYTNYIRFNSQKESINSDRQEGVVTVSDLIVNYDVGMSACLFNRKLCYDKNICFDEKYSLIEDFDYFLSIELTHPLYYLSEPLVKYRMHEESLSVQSKDGWSAEYYDLFNKLKSKGVVKDYPKELNRLEIRAINAEITERINRGERWAVLKIVVKNIYKSPLLLFPLLYVLLGKNAYYKIYYKIRKTEYSV